jgi:hypothetical protein
MNTILVCGLGRCGSSLVMQMLDAGGYPCLGNGPAYEPEEVSYRRDMKALLRKECAIKILDPHRTPWTPVAGYGAIWLHRDFKQQAKSQAKFVRIVSGLHVSGQAWRSIASSLRSEESQCLKILCGSPLLKLEFAQLLEHPTESAVSLAEFTGRNLDVEKMASCVFRRSADCQRGLDIEMSLIQDTIA